VDSIKIHGLEFILGDIPKHDIAFRWLFSLPYFVRPARPVAIFNLRL
jgi:hypothetical protein